MTRNASELLHESIIYRMHVVMNINKLLSNASDNCTLICLSCVNYVYYHFAR